MPKLGMGLDAKVRYGNCYQIFKGESSVELCAACLADSLHRNHHGDNGHKAKGHTDYKACAICAEDIASGRCELSY